MFLSRCELLRQKLDQPAITTDVIVGFPGESEADFEETLRVCREAAFCKIHAFPFSARRGTPAATMPEQIAPEVKKSRCGRLAAVEKELQEAYYRSLLGRELAAIVEHPSDREGALLTANSCRFAPVEIPSRDERLCGRMIVARPTAVREGKLVADAFEQLSD